MTKKTHPNGTVKISISGTGRDGTIRNMNYVFDTSTSEFFDVVEKVTEKNNDDDVPVKTYESDDGPLIRAYIGRDYAQKKFDKVNNCVSLIPDRREWSKRKLQLDLAELEVVDAQADYLRKLHSQGKIETSAKGDALYEATLKLYVDWYDAKRLLDRVVKNPFMYRNMRDRARMRLNLAVAECKVSHALDKLNSHIKKKVMT